MEQLHVLAGEPLHVIDFRYHLVSLIAVFLAVALGIIIGTTALNEPLQANIEGQVTELEQDKRALEDRTQRLQAQVDTSDAFADAVAPALVEGALTDSSVLLVVGNEEVLPDQVEEVSALITEAGGTVSGTIRLGPEYSDPATASSLQNYVTGPGMPPAGVELPETDDAGQLVGSLLSQVLMIPAGGPAPDGAATSSVLAGLVALDVLASEGDSVAPADYAVVLTSGAFTGDDAAERNATLVELISALDAAGSGAVVAGDEVSAQETGLIGVLRADPNLSAAVSTVDNLGTGAGRVSTVLALGGEAEGTSGRYGTGEDAQPVPPLPGTTP
jgi:Copper transport outer membrane protein, MctB